MDASGRAGRGIAAHRCPRAHLLRPAGKEGYLIERAIRQTHHSVETGFSSAQRLSKLRLVLNGHLRQLHFQRACQRGSQNAVAYDFGLQTRLQLISVVKLVFTGIDDYDNRLGGEELELVDAARFVGCELLIADGFTVFQSVHERCHQPPFAF